MMDCLLCSVSSFPVQGSNENPEHKNQHEFLSISENIAQSLCQLLDVPITPFLDYLIQPNICICVNCIALVSDVADLFEQIEQIQFQVRQSRDQVQKSIVQALELKQKANDTNYGLGVEIPSQSALALEEERANDQISTGLLRYKIIKATAFGTLDLFVNPSAKTEESQATDPLATSTFVGEADCNDYNSDFSNSPPGSPQQTPSASSMENLNHRVLRVSLKKLDDADIQNIVYNKTKTTLAKKRTHVRANTKGPKLTRGGISDSSLVGVGEVTPVSDFDIDSNCPIFPNTEKRMYTKPKTGKRCRAKRIFEIPIPCTFPECSKLFKTTCARVFHLKKVHNVVHPYLCPHCSKPCKSQELYDTHIRTHTVEVPFICDVCGKGFISAKYLANHSTLHTGERRIECTICGKTLFGTTNMQRHQMSHRGEKSYMCEFCPRAFTTNENLQYHQGKAHPEEEGVELLKCQYCPKIISGKIMLARHENTHGKELPYECTICRNRFDRPCRLKRHILSHSLEKTVKCPEPGCDKSFKYRSQLSVHKRDHTGERFKCSMCEKTYKLRAYLQEHEARHHSDIRPFKCPLCGDGFPSKRYLRLHNIAKHKLGKVPLKGHDNDEKIKEMS